MHPRDSPIFHMVIESELRAQLEADVYRPLSLSEVGFVHCAPPAAVIPVAMNTAPISTAPVARPAQRCAAIGGTPVASV